MATTPDTNSKDNSVSNESSTPSLIEIADGAFLEARSRNPRNLLNEIHKNQENSISSDEIPSLRVSSSNSASSNMQINFINNDGILNNINRSPTARRNSLDNLRRIDNVIENISNLQLSRIESHSNQSSLSNNCLESCHCSPINGTLIDDSNILINNGSINENNNDDQKNCNDNLTTRKAAKLRKLYNANDSPCDTVMKWATGTLNAPNKDNSSVPLPIFITHNLRKLIQTETTTNRPISKPKKNTKKPRSARRNLNFTSKIKKDTNALQSQKPTSHSPIESQTNYSSDKILIQPKLNRRSTFDFLQVSKISTQRVNRRMNSSIVGTRFSHSDTLYLIEAVKKLGSFVTENVVSEKTTHLIAKEPKRTINLLRAIVRGCWIVKYDWLVKSVEVGKWLPEEEFELTEFSPAVQQCRKERQAFNNLYSMDIFQNCGPIYIAPNSSPSQSDLCELIDLCKGVVTNNIHTAEIIVGQCEPYRNIPNVGEQWILDSITFNRCKYFKKYLIT